MKKKSGSGLSAALFCAALAAGLAIALLVAVGKGLKPGMPVYRVTACLGSGFLAAGLSVGLPGLILFLVSRGAFDRVVYEAERVSGRGIFASGGKPLSFEKFRRQKQKRRKPPQLSLLLAGMIFLLLAAVCFALCYNLPT